MNLTIILSSVRENRLAEKVLKRVHELINEDIFQITIVDPMKYDLPLLNKRYFEMENPEGKFRELHDIFFKTDGFILITGEYNHGIPPALKNILDHFLYEYKYKACGIVSYSIGVYGGARAAEQLRLVCSELGMPPIPIAPAWSFAHKSNEPEGKLFLDSFEKKIKIFIKQLEWYTQAFIMQRKISDNI